MDRGQKNELGQLQPLGYLGQPICEKGRRSENRKKLESSEENAFKITIQGLSKPGEIFAKGKVSRAILSESKHELCR